MCDAMKERFYLHLGDAEILSVIVRNGLFGGSWKRMRREMTSGGLILPGITLHTLTHLTNYEYKYRMNLDRVLFSNLTFHPRTHKNTEHQVHIHRQHYVQRMCYSICRGIFSYPCVAEDNRVHNQHSGKMIYRTYLARPIFEGLDPVPVVFHEGVNRMMSQSNQFPKPSGSEHDRLLEQLNKIRECGPCNDQNSCIDHQYVMESTQTVIKEYQLENSFIGKILARSLCWMTAEEARLMRLIEKEGLKTDAPAFIAPPDEEPERDDYFPTQESESIFSEHSEPVNIPMEPNPLLDVIHDLRESIRDTIRLLLQLHERDIKKP